MKQKLALVLVLVMLIGILPFQARADEVDSVMGSHLGENSLRADIEWSAGVSTPAKRDAAHSTVELPLYMSYLQGVAGKTLYMELSVESKSTNDIVFVEIYKNFISDANIVGSVQSEIPAKAGNYALRCKWNTEGISAGKYELVFGVAYREGGKVYLCEDSIQKESIALLKEPNPITRIGFHNAEADKPIKVKMDRIEHLSVKIRPASATDCRYVTVRCSDPTMLEVSEACGIISLKPLRIGSCKLTVKVANVTLTQEVMVYIPTSFVVMSQRNAQLHVGETLQLYAVPIPENTTETFKWFTSDRNVARVDESGLVTAVGGGTTIIRAWSGTWGGDCWVEVEPHDFEDVPFAEVYCTTPESTMGTCRICGIQEEHISIPALGHYWEKVKPEEPIAPNEEATGYYENYICKRCGATRRKFVPISDTCDGESCPTRGFCDAPSKDYWAHSGIDFVVSRGLFAGVTTSSFAPTRSMQRAMLVAVLWRLDGKPEPEKVPDFVDVPQDQYYAKAVAWASENGVVAGIGNKKFDPYGDVTREQIAAFLYRYAKLRAYDVYSRARIDTFLDAQSVSDYAIDPIRWTVAEGLIYGIPISNGSILQPKATANRQQAAAILMRFAYEVMCTDLTNN